VFEIEIKGFLCHQMDRDRVTAEGVEDEYIKILWMSFGKFMLKRNARIAFNGRDLCLAVLEKRKVISLSLRQIDDDGVDLIQTIFIAGLPIRGQRAGAETQQAHF